VVARADGAHLLHRRRLGSGSRLARPPSSGDRRGPGISRPREGGRGDARPRQGGRGEHPVPLRQRTGRGRGRLVTTRQADAVLWFDHADCRRVEVAGGKGASLASMTALGLPVPPGFLVPASALDRALHQSGHASEMLSVLSSIKGENDVEPASEQLQRLVLDSPITGTLAEAIADAYESLDQGGGVAVRSSACAEDGEVASYAGQQDTYLNVRGADQVLHYVNRCWASFFGTRALFYRRLKRSLQDQI